MHRMWVWNFTTYWHSFNGRNYPKHLKRGSRMFDWIKWKYLYTSKTMFILTMMNNSILILINYKEKTSWRKTWNWHCQKVSTKRKLNFEILPVCTKIIDLNNNNFGIRNLTPWAQRDAAQCATFDQSDIAWLRKVVDARRRSFSKIRKRQKKICIGCNTKYIPIAKAAWTLIVRCKFLVTADCQLNVVTVVTPLVRG